MTNCTQNETCSPIVECNFRQEQQQLQRTKQKRRNSGTKVQTHVKRWFTASLICTMIIEEKKIDDYYSSWANSWFIDKPSHTEHISKGQWERDMVAYVNQNTSKLFVSRSLEHWNLLWHMSNRTPRNTNFFKNFDADWGMQKFPNAHYENFSICSDSSSKITPTFYQNFQNDETFCTNNKNYYRKNLMKLKIQLSLV